MFGLKNIVAVLALAVGAMDAAPSAIPRDLSISSIIGEVVCPVSCYLLGWDDMLISPVERAEPLPRREQGGCTQNESFCRVEIPRKFL
jgi:hypothetical protein